MPDLRIAISLRIGNVSAAQMNPGHPGAPSGEERRAQTVAEVEGGGPALGVAEGSVQDDRVEAILLGKKKKIANWGSSVRPLREGRVERKGEDGSRTGEVPRGRMASVTRRQTASTGRCQRLIWGARALFLRVVGMRGSPVCRALARVASSSTMRRNMSVAEPVALL